VVWNWSIPVITTPTLPLNTQQTSKITCTLILTPLLHILKLLFPPTPLVCTSNSNAPFTSHSPRHHSLHSPSLIHFYLIPNTLPNSILSTPLIHQFRLILFNTSPNNTAPLNFLWTLSPYFSTPIIILTPYNPLLSANYQVTRDEPWSGPTQAYFWPAVNKGPTWLLNGYILIWPDDIFLTRWYFFDPKVKIEKFGIFCGNFPDPEMAYPNWPRSKNFTSLRSPNHSYSWLIKRKYHSPSSNPHSPAFPPMT